MLVPSHSENIFVFPRTQCENIQAWADVKKFSRDKFESFGWMRQNYASRHAPPAAQLNLISTGTGDQWVYLCISDQVHYEMPPLEILKMVVRLQDE